MPFLHCDGITFGKEGKMKQSSSQKRGTWFWVGVTLLNSSILFWIILLWGIVANSEDIGDTILTGVFFTAIPIGIGIYGIKRGRKAPDVDVQWVQESAYTRQPTVKPSTFKEVKGFVGRKVFVRETHTSNTIVVKRSVWSRIVAWFLLLFGVLMFAFYGVVSLDGVNTDTLIPAGFGFLFIVLGIWLLGLTARVTLNKSLGHITVERVFVPLFLWFLRTKHISRDEARSVFVDSIEKSDEYTSGTVYAVKVIMSSGKKATLYDGGFKSDVAVYLAKRILDFTEACAYRQT